MKHMLLAASLSVAAIPVQAADVGLSITVGDPNFYGRIDIGGFPQPRLVFPQPVIVEPVATPPAPVYLHVPPGHAKHWSKHCREYNACGQRVYFVDDDWYNREYVPRYKEKHHGHGDVRHDDDRGKGHGNGHGNGRGG